MVGLATASHAGSLTTGTLWSGLSSGGGAAPSCSNSLDFSQACNSQYITVI